MYFCVVSFSVWFVCIAVLNYCHRVTTQLQLNISHHVISVDTIEFCMLVETLVTFQSKLSK